MYGAHLADTNGTRKSCIPFDEQCSSCLRALYRTHSTRAKSINTPKYTRYRPQLLSAHPARRRLYFLYAARSHFRKTHDENRTRHDRRGKKISVSELAENTKAYAPEASFEKHIDVQKVYADEELLYEAHERSGGGAGLGLSIVKSIMSALGGTVRAESEARNVNT